MTLKPAKHTFRVVINHDALGLTTQLAEEMQRSGLKGKIARVIREGKSREYHTDLTFEGSKGNVEETKTFVRRLGVELSTFEDVSFVGFGNLKVEKTPDTFHRSGSSGGKEVIYEITSNQASSLKSTVSSSRSKEFRGAVLSRDGNSCVFCSGCNNLEAAHIYPLLGRKDKPPIIVAQLRYANETRNGILLCHQCHVLFDKGLWWIELDGETYVGKISDALQGSRIKYRSLHNHTLRLDYKDRDAPLTATLKIQEDFCKKKRNQRHEKMTKKPFRCTVCSSESTMSASKENLEAHTRKGMCRVSPTKAIYTPLKAKIPEGVRKTSSEGTKVRSENKKKKRSSR